MRIVIAPLSFPPFLPPIVTSGIAGVLATRGLGLSIFQGSVLIFLPDKSFHARIGLVDIGRDGGLDIFRVENLVHEQIAVRFHVLDHRAGPVSSRVSLQDQGKFTYIHLFGRPSVHGQGLDLGNMCSQLAVDCGAPHTQEDTHLFVETHDQFKDSGCKCRDKRGTHTFQLAHPIIDRGIN